MTMLQSSVRSKFSLMLLPLGAVIVDLLYAPNNADPLNPVKFWAIGFIALYCLADLSTGIELFNFSLRGKMAKTVGFLLLFFVVSLFFACIFTPVKLTALIGFSGRNNGLLSYLFLIIIFLYASLTINLSSLKYFYRIVISICFIFSSYGLLQHFKLDPIKWQTAYNPIALTVGNPDFAAALLGMFAVILFAILFTDTTGKVKIPVMALIIFTVVIIYWSQARQGLVATAFGVGILLVAALWQKSKKAAFLLFGTELVAGVASILGMLQIGPLTHFLYKSSINDRGYDWRAAWHMFTTHPWTGVGIDSYADFFFKYRDAKYPLIYGYSTSVNNSHNIFLELIATGGIFVGISYLFLIFFIAWRSYKAWKKYSGSQQMLVMGIVSGWVIFVAQSVISVDNLCVSIWGWILGGAVVGLSIDSPADESRLLSGNGRIKSSNKKNRLFSKKVVTFLILGSVYFTVVVFPMYQTESRMRYFQRVPAPASANQQSIYNQIAENAFNSRFMNPDYRAFIAYSVTNSGDIALGTSLFEKVLKIDPRRYDVNQFLATINEHYKNYPLAIKYRLAARALNPYGADSLLNLMKDYLANGEKQKAISVRDSIFAMAPGTDVASQASTLLPTH